MQQAGDLERGDSSRRVPQPRRDSHAHTRGPERVWAVISGDHSAGSARVRIVIQTQERGGEWPRDQERSWIERRVHHTSPEETSSLGCCCSCPLEISAVGGYRLAN